jgi:hypothetical protein
METNRKHREPGINQRRRINNKKTENKIRISATIRTEQFLEQNETGTK